MQKVLFLQSQAMKEKMDNTLEVGRQQNMEELYSIVRSILASAR